MKMIVDLTREDFDYELEKVHRLRIIGQNKAVPKPQKVIYKFGTSPIQLICRFR